MPNGPQNRHWHLTLTLYMLGVSIRPAANSSSQFTTVQWSAWAVTGVKENPSTSDNSYAQFLYRYTVQDHSMVYIQISFNTESAKRCQDLTQLHNYCPNMATRAESAFQKCRWKRVVIQCPVQSSTRHLSSSPWPPCLRIFILVIISSKQDVVVIIIIILLHNPTNISSQLLLSCALCQCVAQHKQQIAAEISAENYGHTSMHTHTHIYIILKHIWCIIEVKFNITFIGCCCVYSPGSSLKSPIRKIKQCTLEPFLNVAVSSTSMVWPTLGSRTAKEQNRIEQCQWHHGNQTDYVHTWRHPQNQNITLLSDLDRA